MFFFCFYSRDAHLACGPHMISRCSPPRIFDLSNDLTLQKWECSRAGPAQVRLGPSMIWASLRFKVWAHLIFEPGLNSGNRARSPARTSNFSNLLPRFCNSEKGKREWLLQNILRAMRKDVTVMLENLLR